MASTAPSHARHKTGHLDYCSAILGCTLEVYKQACNFSRLARLFCNGTDRLPIATVVEGVPVDSVGIEAYVPRVVRMFSIEGRSPVEATDPLVDEASAVPAACGWKEDTIPIDFAGYQSSVYAVQSGPSPGAIVL